MDFAPSTVWWVLAGLVVAAELATGTFYLLMAALGLSAGAVAAHLGLSLSQQVIGAAVVSAGATAAWHWHRKNNPRSAPASHNRDVNLDIGERVTVAAWNGDRTARVNHRGTTWTARLEAGSPALPGEHVVRAVEGNALIVAPLPHPPL